MMINVMKSKIHFATVTQADVMYEGSITIDEDLLEQANMLPGERVQIVNIHNGERLETYTIAGERGSGIIGMNGPAALKCSTGNVIHIISYAMMDFKKAKNFTGKVLVLEHHNKIKNVING